MAGRNPKPEKLKVLQGTSRKDRKREEIKPPAAEPFAKPPTWLKGEGRKQWKKLLETLVELGLVTEIDLDTFAHYCQLHGNLVQNYYKLGIPAPPPMLAQYRLYSGMFGLDPQSRVKIPPKKKKDTPQSKFGSMGASK